MEVERHLNILDRIHTQASQLLNVAPIINVDKLSSTKFKHTKKASTPITVMQENLELKGSLRSLD